MVTVELAAYNFYVGIFFLCLDLVRGITETNEPDRPKSIRNLRLFILSKMCRQYSLFRTKLPLAACVDDSLLSFPQFWLLRMLLGICVLCPQTFCDNNKVRSYYRCCYCCCCLWICCENVTLIDICRHDDGMVAARAIACRQNAIMYVGI